MSGMESGFLITTKPHLYPGCMFTSGDGSGGGGLEGLEPPPNNDIVGGSAPPNQTMYNCYSLPARSLAYTRPFDGEKGGPFSTNNIHSASFLESYEFFRA